MFDDDEHNTANGVNPEVRPTAQSTPDSTRNIGGQQNRQQGIKTTRATLKIASLNIRGGGSQNTNDKWQHMNQLLHDKKIGILAIQETHISDERIEQLHEQFSQRVHIIHSRDPEQPNAKGVAFILNKQLTTWKEATSITIIPGHALLLNIPWHGESKLNILAVYAPNSAHDNKEFWNDLTTKFIENNFAPPDIILGYYNLVEESIDRLPAHRDAWRATSALAEFKSLFFLADGWRQENPMELAYTFLQKATGVQSQIDRIYATDIILKNSREWMIQNTSLATDHKLVSMQFFDPGAPFIGKGRWTVPLFLLEDKNVMRQVKELGMTLADEIERCKFSRTPEKNPQTLYKKFKTDATSFIRKYAITAIPKLTITGTQ